MRDQSLILILSLLGEKRAPAISGLCFTVDEGPDIVGSEEEIRELQRWQQLKKNG